MKPVLSANYIYDTYTRALEASTKGTIPHLPNIEDYLVIPTKQQPRLLSDTESEEDTPRKRRKIDQGDSIPDLEMWDEDIELEDVPRLCVERPSPLICVNQDLVCLHLHKWCERKELMNR
jgi:DNA polymerase mu